MMFDLRNNSFFVLGVTPKATKVEIAEAFEEFAFAFPEKEHEFHTAKTNLLVPKSRLLEELTYLWGVPLEHWERLILSTSEFWNQPIIARMNLAANYCFSLNENTNFATSLSFVKPALYALIVSKDIDSELYKKIKVNRKKAQLPPPQETHYEEALATISALHRKAAMNAVDYVRQGGLILAEIVIQWRNANTKAGRFVMELCHDYDRWTIDKLRPIEQKIDQVIKALKAEDFICKNFSTKEYMEYIEGRVDRVTTQLNELESLLAEWNDYSQPMQLMYKAKGLDDPKSGNLVEKLRTLYQKPDFKSYMPTHSLRISLMLLKTFSALPESVGRIETDIKNLKARVNKSYT